jgi:hypothetical protein
MLSFNKKQGKLGDDDDMMLEASNDSDKMVHD